MDKLNLADARLRFSLRAKMTKTVQMNFKGDKKYTQNQWKCQDCKIPDTQDHIVRCPAYQHLRIDKNLSNDKDLVSYFRKVIQIREKLEDERTYSDEVGLPKDRAGTYSKMWKETEATWA